MCAVPQSSHSLHVGLAIVRTVIVLICDEINLPEEDTYGTQRVIMFMRQLVEHQGFWRSDNTWVKIDRIQFVGACNPPTDAGRVEMSHRFLRHVPLLLVDFPEKDSLMQIYGTFSPITFIGKQQATLTSCSKAGSALIRQLRGLPIRT